MDPKLIADANFLRLGGKAYIGCLIILARDERRNPVQIYAVTGRSEGSRNRRLVHTGRSVFDAESMENEDFTRYNAMWESHGLFVLSNGRQTDTVMDGFFPRAAPSESLFGRSLETTKYKEDVHCTPRITGIHTGLWNGPQFQFSVIRKSPTNSSTQRFIYDLGDIDPGFGYCVHTYEGNDLVGGTLPSFDGSPFLVPVRGDIEEIAQTWWNVLNKDNRVALAVKRIQDGRGAVKIINTRELAAA